jgi:AcrR family transcriptional regulator
VNLEERATTRATRRRGEALEAAILDAAWEQLVEAGYGAFTYEAIAARAGTSRPVLYRRWPTREELVVAALRREWAARPVRLPDTGSLREDAIRLLEEVNRARMGTVAVMSVLASDLYTATGRSFAELRDMMRAGAPSGFQRVLDHAAARGELDLARIPARVVEVPIDLFRHDLIMTLATVPRARIEEIVDDVWLPMLRAYGARIPG